MAKEIIDLTYPIHEGMTGLNVPWHPLTEVAQLGRIGHEGRETRRVTFGTHTGTHMDAPLHFVEGGKSIDQIPLDRLIGPVTILDRSGRDSRIITATDFEKKDGIRGSKLLFKFGWGKHWGTRKFYQDWDYFTYEAAQFLVQKGVDMVAMDTPSPDDPKVKICGGGLGGKNDSPIHKLFLSSGIILVEYVANLDQVVDYERWDIHVIPLPIRGADGSPARVYLTRDKKEE